MRFVLAVALASVAYPSLAMAQSDYDQRWVERSIRAPERQEVRRECCREVRRHAPVKPKPVKRHEAPKQVYYVAPTPAFRDAPHVAGIETRGAQRIERDVLSNVSCLPPLSAISQEFVDPEAAWRNAQLAWENLVRWRYGERVASIAHAAEVTRRCSRSSFPQSVAGRAVERIADAVGVDGFKTRCEVQARPCMAPADINPARKGE